jgi:hypothetical protein
MTNVSGGTYAAAEAWDRGKGRGVTLRPLLFYTMAQCSEVAEGEFVVDMTRPAMIVL